MRHLPAARELVLKIVYCGPGMAGKSTNLTEVRRRLPAERVSDLVIVDHHSERTMRFDWRADELGQVQGCQVRVELHTIPGQSYYAATRRQLLVGVDAIVFVADSRREALDENIDALNELFGNLRQLAIPDDLPIVIQYNKQDLPTALTRDQLAPLLNPRNWPAFSASATQGQGVAETLDAALGPLLQQAMEVGLPPADALPATNLWLLSCWRCQNMVDATVGTPGAIVTCPVCKSSMEIVDPDHGITQAPTSSDNIAEMIETAKPSAASSIATSTLSRGPATATEVPASIPGYTVVKELERSPLGTRLRLREVATGRTLRAHVWSRAVLEAPGYRDALDPFVRLAAPVRHAHLLPVVAYHPSGDQVILLSDDPPGHQPLARVLARRGVIPPPQAIGVARQIAMALDEAAKAGVVHGWLRPEVVLVDEQGGVLLDELAVPVAPRHLVRELAGESAGTEYFLAPEYLDESAWPDVRTDMFLLGALLFRMITGEPMVAGYNAHEALHRVTATGCRGLRDLQPGVSRDLHGLHQRLTAADRRERFRSWSEVLEALDRFGGGAKRQELQLTRQFNRSPTAPARPAPSASGSRAPAAGGSAGAPRRSEAAPRAQDRRSSTLMIIAVVAVVLALAAIAVAVVIAQRSAPSARPAPSEVPSTPVARPSAPSEAPARPPTPAPAVRPPAPSSVPVAPVVDEGRALQARRDLLVRLGEFKVAERFGEALQVVDRLPDPQDRAEQRQQVLQAHAERKDAIEALLGQGVSTPRIAEALHPARTTWNMPGDEEWVATVMARASARAMAGVVPEPVATAPVAPAAEAPAAPSPEPASEPPLPPVAVEPAVAAQAQVVRALVAANLRGAQAGAGALPAGTPASRALLRMTEVWRNRLAPVQRVLNNRSAKLRLPHPTTGEAWDVSRVAEDRVAIMAPSGSASELPWSQVAPRAQARLLADAVQVPGAGALDVASAAVQAMLADDSAQAAVQLRRARPALVADLAADLDLALDLNQRRIAAAVLSRGIEAANAGNQRVANEVLNDLRRLDRNLVASRADVIARLERLVASRAAAASVRPDTPLPADLRERQAALRTAGWDPLGQAYLDAPAVVIPPGSGISTPIPPLAVGYHLGLSGAGMLRILPARGSTPLGSGLSLSVPAETTFVSVRLTREGVALVDAAGKVLDQVRTPGSPTHLLLRATAEVRLAAVPQPIIP